MARTPGSHTRCHAVAGARQRAWNALRVYKVFTAAEIAPVADIGERNLRAYLKALAWAGYLRLERPKQNGKVMGHAVWRLVRNSGPHSPLVCRDGSGVWDPNHGCLYPDPNQATRLEENSDDRGTLDERVA